jgi:Flp pilus assembly protein TadG
MTRRMMGQAAATMARRAVRAFGVTAALALRDRRGAMAALGAMLLTVVIGGAVLALDMGRVRLAQDRLQAATDAAALAGARAVAEGAADAAEQARQVFAANFREAQALRVESVSAVPVSGQMKGLRFSATMEVKLLLGSLPAFLTPETLREARLTAEAEAEIEARTAEIVLALDNTGSMDGAKIADLRRATGTLIAALFGGETSSPNLQVGIVPYSASVNVGRQHADWLAQPPATADDGFAPTRWKGCVMERAGALAESDDPPMSGMRFPIYRWPASAACRAPRPSQLLDGRYACTALDGADAYHSRSPNVWPQHASDGSLLVDERRASMNNGYGPNLGCVAPITPFTADRATLEAATPMLEAWGRGGTMANVGLVWASRMLSPQWNGLWRTAEGAPLAHQARPFDAPGHVKIVVLMTDGQNGWFNEDYTAFGRPGGSLSPSGLDSAMLRICSRLKEQGVVLYTITFGSVNATIQNRFRSCASDPTLETRVPGPKYFHAPSGATLTEAFQDIAGQLTDLRLID